MDYTTWAVLILTNPCFLVSKKKSILVNIQSCKWYSTCFIKKCQEGPFKTVQFNSVCCYCTDHALIVVSILRLAYVQYIQ